MSPLPNTKPAQQVPATRQMVAKTAMSPAELENLHRRPGQSMAGLRRNLDLTPAERQLNYDKNKEWRKDQCIITGKSRTNVFEHHHVREFVVQKRERPLKNFCFSLSDMLNVGKKRSIPRVFQLRQVCERVHGLNKLVYMNEFLFCKKL